MPTVQYSRGSVMLCWVCFFTQSVHIILILPKKKKGHNFVCQYDENDPNLKAKSTLKWLNRSKNNLLLTTSVLRPESCRKPTTPDNLKRLNLQRSLSLFTRSLWNNLDIFSAHEAHNASKVHSSFLSTETSACGRRRVQIEALKRQVCVSDDTSSWAKTTNVAEKTTQWQKEYITAGGPLSLSLQNGMNRSWTRASGTLSPELKGSVFRQACAWSNQ